jgi:hypothetical protein
MPAELETMAYAGATPWHGLGTPLTDDDLYDWQRTCMRAGLDWDIELVPLMTADTHATVTHRAVRRTTDTRILGVVGPRYTILQNRDAFAWFQPFLLGVGEPPLAAEAASLVSDGHCRPFAGGSRKRARMMAMPVTPLTSLTTSVSFTFICSKAFCMCCTCWAE